MYESSTNKLGLSSDEYFHNVEDIPETPTEIKAYVPKLMPKIEMGDAPKTDIKLYINRSIFANSSDCAVVQTPLVCNGQNFVTLKPFGNERPNYRGKAVLENGKYIVKRGNTFIMSVLHGDILNMYFTSKT